MKFARKLFVIMIVACLSVGMAAPVAANKSAVRIEVPPEVSQGATISIKLHVTHEGNSWFHYTNWVRVTVNGSELKRWEFSRKNRPENENFTLVVEYQVTAPFEIVAEANCNLHGSQAPDIVAVAMTE